MRPSLAKWHDAPQSKLWLGDAEYLGLHVRYSTRGSDISCTSVYSVLLANVLKEKVTVIQLGLLQCARIVFPRQPVLTTYLSNAARVIAKDIGLRRPKENEQREELKMSKIIRLP